MLLNPALDLTLRPMKYPVFFQLYKSSIKNTWTTEERSARNTPNSSMPPLKPRSSS